MELLIANEAINLAGMTIEQLCPAANRDVRDNLEIRKNQQIKKNVSTLYTCSKCKENRTTLSSKQTRACDESSTVFITCENCQFKWTRT